MNDLPWRTLQPTKNKKINSEKWRRKNRERLSETNEKYVQNLKELIIDPITIFTCRRALHGDRLFLYCDSSFVYIKKHHQQSHNQWLHPEISWFPLFLKFTRIRAQKKRSKNLYTLIFTQKWINSIYEHEKGANRKKRHMKCIHSNLPI